MLGVGFMIFMKLEQNEADGYEKQGTNYIESLVREINRSPDSFRWRDLGENSHMRATLALKSHFGDST